MEASEPVLVALPPERLERFRQALEREERRNGHPGALTGNVVFVDMAEAGRNPARLLAALQGFLATGGDRPVRALGEPVWASRRPEEIRECELHEALLNTAIDPDLPVWLRCSFEVGALPDEVVEEAEHSHPLLTGPDGLRGSTRYDGLHHVQTLFRSPLPEPTVPVRSATFGPDDLREVRARVTREAVRAGLDATTRDDVVLAVHEVAVNSTRHGGGAGRLRSWSTPAGAVWEIQDSGSIDDPLVGRVPPPLDAEGGRGVWIAHQLTDLMQIRSSDTGTTVRISSWR